MCVPRTYARIPETIYHRQLRVETTRASWGHAPNHEQNDRDAKKMIYFFIMYQCTHNNSISVVFQASIAMSEPAAKLSLRALDDTQTVSILKSIHDLNPKELKERLQLYLNSKEWVRVSSKECTTKHGIVTLYVVNYIDWKCNKQPIIWWENNPQFAEARGLLLIEHADGTVEFRGVIPKFHSYTKHGLDLETLPGELFVMDKVDGTLVYASQVYGKVVFWTRNGFDSPQASKYVRELLTKDDAKVMLDQPGCVLGMELIHHNDPKVEDERGENKLVLLYAHIAGHTYPQDKLGDVAKMFSAKMSAIEWTTMSGVELHEYQDTQTSYPVREGKVVLYRGRLYKVKCKAYLIFANGMKFALQDIVKDDVKDDKDDDTDDVKDEKKNKPAFIQIQMDPPSRLVFRGKLLSSDEMPENYRDCMVRTGNIPDRVLKTLKMDVVQARFKSELGLPLFQSMESAWTQMVEEHRDFQEKLIARVESILSDMSEPKEIFSMNKKCVEFNVIMAMKNLLNKDIKQVLNEEKRKECYQSPEFKRVLFKLTKRAFPLLAPSQ